MFVGSGVWIEMRGVDMTIVIGGMHQEVFGMRFDV